MKAKLLEFSLSGMGLFLRTKFSNDSDKCVSPLWWGFESGYYKCH